MAQFSSINIGFNTLKVNLMDTVIFSQFTLLSMGQWLSVPLILIGVFLFKKIAK
jgi:prolipoprotein diacylglyceryltransferase